MNKRTKLSITISLLLLFVSLSATSLTNADVSLEILVVGTDIDDAFMKRLELDPQFVLTIDTEVGTDVSGYDSVLIFDYAPNPSETILLDSFTGGIAIFIFENLSADATLLSTLGLASGTSGVVSDNTALPVPKESNATHPIKDSIPWNSVPTITNYTTVPLAGTILVETSSTDTDAGLALISTNDDDRLIAFNMIPRFDKNPELIEWPYFNYMLYLTIMSINDEAVETYANWDYSPVPHTLETILLGVSVVLTVIVTLGGYVFSRRYSKNSKIEHKDLTEISKEETKKWEEVGMHRQLGGFLVQLFAGILIILPNAVMTALIFPAFILPSPQAVGFYDYTIKFFEALWLFFDFGTSVVLVKFFSEHRVKRPEHAIKYVQLFVWFQMISGIAQLFLISFIGSIVFPRTFLAHMSWLFVTHAFFQWPAFFLVFMYLFQAMNRIDLFQILNLLLYAVLNITLQYLIIILFRYTLGNNPIFGQGLAGAIGYSVGFYVIQFATFLIGLFMFKRLGFSLKTIFRIDFTWAEVKEALKFGTKWMMGAIMPPLGWFIQLFLLSRFLPNYTQQQGYFSIAWNFAMIVMLVGLFANGFLPAVSESYHAKKEVLTRYYTLSSLKWSAYFDWFLVGTLAAVGWRFIIGGAGAEWAPAGGLILWFLFFHAIGYFSWLGDWMFAGSDRPGWAAASWVIEQAIRAGLLAIFIPLNGPIMANFPNSSPMILIMFAYFPALIIKNIFMWIMIRRNDYFKFKWKDLYWQGLIAPLISAGIIFGIMEGLFTLIWQGEIITSVVILLIGTLFGLYIFAFIASFFGAFDDNTLGELKTATEMAGGFKFMAKPLYKMSEWGAKISPLHNKFKVSIFEEAREEAKQLTEEKAALVI
jgi:O-antigen/teichoic acid export membrane protein